MTVRMGTRPFGFPRPAGHQLETCTTLQLSEAFCTPVDRQSKKGSPVFAPVRAPSTMASYLYTEERQEKAGFFRQAAAAGSATVPTARSRRRRPGA